MLSPETLSLLKEGRARAALAKVYSQLLTSPTVGTQRLRVLFDRHRPSPENVIDLGSASGDELLESFAFWILALRSMYVDCQNDFEPRHFDAFAAPNGLLELYQDIVLSPEFLLQNKVREHQCTSVLSMF